MTGSECLFATVSIHVENDAEGLDAHDAVAADHLRALLGWREELHELAQSAPTSAIDPLFNDVAPSDRNSRAREFLFGDGREERILLKLPARIGWTTEGALTEIELDKPFEREILCRYFWYFHAGDSLSFHASFELPYDGASLGDLYALSVFQKLIYPTEAGSAGGTPLSGLKCLSGQSFDQFITERFNAKFAALIAHVPGLARKNDKSPNYWSLVHREVMPEAREVRAPLYRTLFILRDRNFFQALRDREEIIFSDNRTLDAIEGQEVARNHFVLDAGDVEARTETSLPYFFMSGFFQNIIDFLNQDSSEIGDGTDAIYPSSEEQKNERMFFRFANGRALYQVVEASRSLEVGRKAIGTCPYIFLVHLMALHNEMITRRYERRSDQLLAELDDGDEPLARVLEPDEKRRAASERADLIETLSEKVDQFRHQAFALYKRYFYSNAFRYDTERDVFESVSKIRGINNRMNYCDEVVKGLNETAQVLETKARYQQQYQEQKSKKHLDILLGLITFMTLIEGILRLHDTYGHLFDRVRSPSDGPLCFLRTSNLCPNGDLTDVVSVIVFFILGGFLAVLIVAFVIFGLARAAGFAKPAGSRRR